MHCICRIARLHHQLQQQVASIVTSSNDTVSLRNAVLSVILYFRHVIYFLGTLGFTKSTTQLFQKLYEKIDEVLEEIMIIILPSICVGSWTCWITVHRVN